MGGMEFLTKERRWGAVAGRMGYPSNRGLGGTLKHHYDKILYPFYLFKKGETVRRIPEVCDLERNGENMALFFPLRIFDKYCLEREIFQTKPTCIFFYLNDCKSLIFTGNFNTTSTMLSCSGPLPTHKIKRHLVSGVVYASSSHLRLFIECHVYVFEQLSA